MTRSSQKTRDTSRKHRMRRKKLEDRAKGLRQVGPSVTAPTRTTPVAAARPAGGPARTPAAGGRTSGATGTGAPRTPRTARPATRPATAGS